MGKYFSRFKEWQNYMHYILNGIFLSTEVWYWELYGLNPVIMLFILIFLIFINDSIIHAIFWFLPKPIRWRD